MKDPSKLPKRYYRVGKLFFKLIMNTPLIKDERVNTAEKLSKVLTEMGVITLVHDSDEDFYYFEAGMEWPDNKLVSAIIKYLSDNNIK